MIKTVLKEETKRADEWQKRFDCEYSCALIGCLWQRRAQRQPIGADQKDRGLWG